MKNIGFKLLYLFTALVIFVEIGFSVKGSLFTDISNLPEGRLKDSIESPTGERTLNIYLIKNNLGVAIRGEIVEDNKSHNIFWQTDIDEVEAIWYDDDTVIINEIPLDADDTFGYDSRRGYSLFDDGALEDNFTDYNRSRDDQE